MSGTYQRVALKRRVTDAVKDAATNDVPRKACGDFLRTNPDRALIYSVAVIKVDASKYVSNVLSDLASSFVAEVKGEVPGVNVANLTATIKNQVETNLTVSSGQEWRIISWDYYMPTQSQV